MMFYVSGLMKYFCTLLAFAFFFKALALSPEDAEQKIAYLHKQLAQSENDLKSDSISQEMRKIFIESFNDPRTFQYSFEQLQMCKLTSSDNRIRIFNWNQPYTGGTHKYYCFILIKENKSDVYTWTELLDNQKEVEKIENKYLTPDKWFGALYYEIIPMDRRGRGDTYTLLGWEGKDNLTTRKVIDAITITGNKIRIGATIFATDYAVRKRYILEYSNEVSASVKYYPKKQCIVMDHLSPRNPLMTGILADYGPDGSYDLFLYKKGKWEFISDIDIAEFADGNDKPFYDPRRSRRK